MKFAMVFPLFLVFSLLIGLAYASDPAGIDVSEFPAMLAEKMNISLFAAQLLASLIILCFPLFPSLLLAGYFGGTGGTMFVGTIVGLATLGFAVVLGWFPAWIFIIIILVVAFLMSRMLSGIWSDRH